MVGACQHSNETRGSIKGGEYLTIRGTVSLRRTLLRAVGCLLLGQSASWLSSSPSVF
jgi:hypothetical protein